MVVQLAAVKRAAVSIIMARNNYFSDLQILKFLFCMGVMFMWTLYVCLHLYVYKRTQDKKSLVL